MNWLQSFPRLNKLPEATRHALRSGSIIRRLSPGHTLFTTGEQCEYAVLILAGALRLQRISEDGHEMTLSHLQPGDCCHISLSCTLANDDFHASIIADTDAMVVLIPKSLMLSLLVECEQWRKLVFQMIGSQVNNLIDMVENVAFGPIEKRLSDRLLKSCNGDQTVYETHKELAADLGTAREVISRTLKRFERAGWISQRRGQITILNPIALEN